MGPIVLLMAVTVQPGFVNGGPMRGGEATEWGVWEGFFPPPMVYIGRFFWKFVHENGIFSHIKYIGYCEVA